MNTSRLYALIVMCSCVWSAGGRARSSDLTVSAATLMPNAVNLPVETKGIFSFSLLQQQNTNW